MASCSYSIARTRTHSHHLLRPSRAQAQPQGLWPGLRGTPLQLTPWPRPRVGIQGCLEAPDEGVSSLLFLARTTLRRLSGELGLAGVPPPHRRNSRADLRLRKPVGKDASGGGLVRGSSRMRAPLHLVPCENLREERVKSPSSLQPRVFLGR